MKNKIDMGCGLSSVECSLVQSVGTHHGAGCCSVLLVDNLFSKRASKCGKANL